MDIIGEEFRLQPGKTREVTVRVTPPSQLIADDEYKFTVIVQPKDMPVAGEPLDLSVESKVSTGILAGDTQTAVAIAIIIVGALGVAYLFMRTRAENRMIEDAMVMHQDD